MTRMAPAEKAGYEDDGGAGFDEQFAAVEPVDAGAFEVGIGEEGVIKEGGGGEVDREVEGFPGAAAELDAEVGCDNDKGEKVESNGADCVFERLLRGVDGVEDVDDAELRRFVEEERQGMKERDGQGNVASPVVKAEIVEAAMRPAADGAVAEGHEDAEEDVDGDGADGGEADVGGEIEGSEVHWRV